MKIIIKKWILRYEITMITNIWCDWYELSIFQTFKIIGMHSIHLFQEQCNQENAKPDQNKKKIVYFSPFYEVVSHTQT